jgi:N-methylhydantoinase A
MGPRPDVAPVVLEQGDGDPKAALVTEHPIYVGGEQVTASVYDRAKLRAGDVVSGPAIVTEMDSTTLVLPDHSAVVHATGSLLINPVEG